MRTSYRTPQGALARKLPRLILIRLEAWRYRQPCCLLECRLHETGAVLNLGEGTMPGSRKPILLTSALLLLGQPGLGAGTHFLDLSGPSQFAGWVNFSFTQGGTFESWVYPVDVVATEARTIASSENNYVFDISPAYALELSLELGPGNWQYYSTGPGLVPVATWSHVAFSYDLTTVRFYLNGVEVASRTTPGGPIFAATSHQVGTKTLGGNQSQEFLRGMLDETRFWSSVRAPAEIALDMASEMAPHPDLIAGWGWNDNDLDVVAGRACPLQNGAGYLAPGHPFLSMDAVSPSRSSYDSPPLSAMISGAGFTEYPIIGVRFGGSPASNVVVVNDSTITCQPPATIQPGPVEVTVQNTLGDGRLPDGFAYTPALQLTGNWIPGGDVTLAWFLDPGDSIYAIFGLPPAQSIRTPPFDGTLCILPYYRFFLLLGWPFDTFTQNLAIPDDPAISGAQVLLQGLVGPSLWAPKDAAWTNCATLSIQ